MKIALNSNEITYMGRIDFDNPLEPQLIFPASTLHFSFIGKSAKITIENFRVFWNNSVGAIIDGVEYKYPINSEGETIITLIDETEDKEHDVLFFKRMDCCHVISIKDLELSDGSKLLPKKEGFKRRIEVYGDSVSAGEVSEAEDYVGKVDPENHNGELSNSYYSYPWIFARKMNAELHNIAQGGIPLMRGTGWIAPEYFGMEDVWDCLQYQNTFNKVSKWDFEKYTPHIVILAVGQNCGNPVNFMEHDYTGEKADMWRAKYKKLVLDIRAKYPKALILLATTILMHHPNWDKAIDEVCLDINDDKVRHFLYTRTGTGTPGHIRGSEAEEMASELEAYVNNLEFDVWED